MTEPEEKMSDAEITAQAGLMGLGSLLIAAILWDVSDGTTATIAFFSLLAFGFFAATAYVIRQGEKPK